MEDCDASSNTIRDNLYHVSVSDHYLMVLITFLTCLCPKYELKIQHLPF